VPFWRGTVFADSGGTSAVLRGYPFTVDHDLDLVFKKSGLFEKKNEAGDVIQAAEPYILFVYPLSAVSDLPRTGILIQFPDWFFYYDCNTSLTA
jgi:hypothetical protein